MSPCETLRQEPEDCDMILSDLLEKRDTVPQGKTLKINYN